MKRLAMVEVRIGCSPGIKRRDAGRHALADGDEDAAEIEEMHQGADGEAVRRPRARSASARRSTSAMTSMIATTHSMRTPRNVIGSM